MFIVLCAICEKLTILTHININWGLLEKFFTKSSANMDTHIISNKREQRKIPPASAEKSRVECPLIKLVRH